MDEITVEQDDGYQPMHADAGVDGTRGARISRPPPAAPLSTPAPPPPETAAFPGSFAQMFNPDKRKVAFEDRGEAENGEESEDEEDDDEEEEEDAAEMPEGVEDEEDVQKAWFLRQMRKLQGAHGAPVRQMTMRHSLREIKAEFHRMCADIDQEEGEQTMKMVLSLVVRGTEFGNSRFGSPFMLNGWSGYFDDEIKTGKHDRVIAQLQAKYSKYTQLGPELQLVKALATSAFFFHIAQKCGGTISAKMQDPDFLSAVMQVHAQTEQGQQAQQAQQGGGFPQSVRQQPMSRPEAAFTIVGGRPQPNVGIHTKPFTYVEEVRPSPPTPRQQSPRADTSRASQASEGGSGSTGSSGIQPMSSGPPKREASVSRSRGRGGKRVLRV